MNQKAIPAIAADFVGVLLLIFVSVPLLSPLLKTPTIRGGSILFLLFILVGLGLNRIKRLESQDRFRPNWLKTLDFSNHQPTLIFLAIAIIFVFVLAQADLNDLWGDTVDLFENTGEVHEGEMTLYITFGPIFIWLMAGALFFAGFVLKTEKVIETDAAAYRWTEFVGLLLINALLGLFGLFLAGWLGRTLPAAGSTVVFLSLSIFLGLMFFPIRGRHTLRHPLPITIISFVLYLIFTAIWVL